MKKKKTKAWRRTRGAAVEVAMCWKTVWATRAVNATEATKATKATEAVATKAAAIKANARTARTAWGAVMNKRACRSRAGLGMASNFFWVPLSLGAVAALVGCLGLALRWLGVVEVVRVRVVRMPRSSPLCGGLLVLKAGLW